MKVLVAQFDLQTPDDLWGLESYDFADVLIRNGGIPIGRLTVRANNQSGIVTVEELQELLNRRYLTASSIVEPSTPSHRPGISVVVCTRDRPLSLRRCLESLRKLHYDKMEVLVIDNASRSSETKEIIAQTLFRYVREDHPGLDWARNRGLYEAIHEIVAYTDDDVQVDSAWLDGIAKGFQHTNVACVTGLVCPLELEFPAQRLFEQYGGMGKGFEARLFAGSQMLPQQLIATHSAGVGANMAFRRDVLLRIGGFDVHLDVGTPANGGGDLDVFHRTLAAGYSIFYEPTALVWHQHRRAMSALHGQIYNNGRSLGCYLLKVAKQRTVARRAVADFALRNWIGKWLLASLVRGGPGRTPMLVVAELWGALHAPYAYWKTYLHQQKE